MSAGKRPPGVMLYFTETRPVISLLDDAERGQLFTAILDYAEYDVEPILSKRLSGVWPFLKCKIDHDAEIYRNKCEKASKAVKSRGEKEGKQG